MAKKQQENQNPTSGHAEPKLTIDRIEQVRREIAEWKAEKRKVVKTAGPIDAALAESDKKIDIMGEKYYSQRPAPGSLCAYLSAPAPDSLADPRPVLELLCSLPTVRAELKAVARQRIESTWPAETMTEADKVARLKGIDQKIFDLEVREEHLILDLEKLGARVDRRADLDPRVFLQIEFQ